MKVNFKDVFKTVKTTVSDHAPALLIGASAAAFIATTIFAVKATPKAMEHIAKKKEELGKDKLTVKETIQACGKDYIPAIVSGVVAAGASVGAAVCSEKEHKVAAGALTALTMSEKTIEDMRDAAKEVVGKTKASDIEAKVAEKHVQEDIKSGVNTYPALEPGQLWFRDSFTGQSFITKHEKLEMAFAQANETAAYDMFVSVSDLFDNFQQIEIGNRVVIPDMDNIGWCGKIGFHLVPRNVYDDQGNIITVVNEINYDYAPTTRERADC